MFLLKASHFSCILALILNIQSITSLPPEILPGYIFLSPYTGVSWDVSFAHGPLQPAPYIFSSSGDLVWSGFGYVSGWAGNFQDARYRGEDVLFVFEGSRNARHGHSHGHVKILDRSYETVREARGGRYSLIDLHEFHVVDEKTALVEIYEPTPYDLGKYGARPESQWIVDAVFREIDIETGRLIFEWKSLDLVSPNESDVPIKSLLYGTGYNSSDALDYFHINSVDCDSEHNYLISGRHTSTIYKINGTGGEIIWRLGGKYSNFSIRENVAFGLQHHARFISRSSDGDETIISLFDSTGKANSEGTGYVSRSSGKLVSLNTRTWRASLLQSFPAPLDEIFAFSQGSTQILPNGAITEFSPNGTVVFHAYLDSGELWEKGYVQNYRGFKFNWTGAPYEEPAVVAFKLKGGSAVALYVSWNGDTETKWWRFYGVDGEGKAKFVGEIEREGFETSFNVKDGGDRLPGAAPLSSNSFATFLFDPANVNTV
ncbi:ASST-domain-containing protein [Rhexocercosporidium sp. MPI-PUGE-AT-0058]|nr:ASST-domain-containing protein [Rhexocercosporidium sp. MPI-PUGE-AT-0058]